MEKNDGGPAFPQNDLSGYDIGPEFPNSGMSLRDWFASQALIGIITRNSAGGPTIGELSEGQRGGIHEARAAYAWATAMLEARED